MAAPVGLETLPCEVFDLVIEKLLPIIGILKAVRLRTTSRAFDLAIMQAICVTQVIDIEDPALNNLFFHMDPRLRGKTLAIRSLSVTAAANSKCYISIIARLSHKLADLANEIDQAVVHRWRVSIAGVVDVHSQKHLADQDEAQNLLCAAAIIGDVFVLKLVLEGEKTGSADVNGLTTFFDQPLTLAAAGGHLAAVQYLLNSGARLDAVPKPGFWLSFPQADYNKKDAHQRRMALRDRRPSTALRTAVQGGHTDIVRLLLRPEYRLDPGSLEYLRAIMAAAAAGRLDLAEALFGAIGKNWFSFKGLRYFIMRKALQNDQKTVVEFLLNTGIKVNAFDDRMGAYRGTLEIAAAKGHVGMVMFLIERGADVTLGGIDHRFPVMKAAACGHDEIVDLLIQHGADPVHAFLGAAKGGQARLLDHLLIHFPDLPTREAGNVGREALEYALRTGLTSITRLVKAGVSLNDGWEPSELPLNAAKRVYGLWVVNHLLSLGARQTDQAIEAVNEPDPRLQRDVGGIAVSERTWEWIGKY